MSALSRGAEEHSKSVMATTDELVIGFSKNKIIFLIVGGCAMVAASAWLLLLDDEYIRTSLGPFPRNPLFIHAVALVGIVLFGLCGVYAIKNLFDKKPGLVLNSSGIIDNSSAFAAGFIPWSDILGAEEYMLSKKQKMLVIKVINPETYIARGGPLRRMLKKTSYKMRGSPIAITAGTLKMDFPDLVSTFERYHQKFGKSLKASV